MSCYLSNVKWAKGKIKKGAVKLLRWPVLLLSALIAVNFASRIQLPFPAVKHEFLITKAQTHQIKASMIS